MGFPPLMILFPSLKPLSKENVEMSNITASFETIDSSNALAGNNFHGPANITFHEPQDRPHTHRPKVYHQIPFPRNDDLVHRNDVTWELDRLLPVTLSYQTAALWGLGGSGKTQIALAYAHSRCRDPTCSVFWVRADSETSFIEDYQSIARKLGLATNLKDEDLLRNVRERIEASPNWVVVFDGADDLALFGVTRAPSKYKLNLALFIPHGPTGTILWTSRDRRIGGSLVAIKRAINIGQMTFGEAKSLLEIMNEDELDAARQLLAELGHLPLAISQAAAYIRRTSTSVRDYLLEVQNKEQKWGALTRLEYDRYRRGQISNVLETWDISFQQLRNENELAYEILHFLAFVDNQNIPFDLIREVARIGKARAVSLNQLIEIDNENESDDYSDITEAISRLCDFSFLRIRTSYQGSWKRAYGIHILVQEAARYRLHRSEEATKDRAYFAKAAFQATRRLFPEDELIEPGDFFLDPQRRIWDRCEQYLAHAQQAAVWAELYNGEVEVAGLLISAYFYLDQQGRTGEAELIIRKAFDFLQNVLGEQHLDSLRGMALLARACCRNKKIEESKKLCQQALRLMGELHATTGARHPDADFARNCLADALKDLERYEEAKGIYQYLIRQAEKDQGKKHPNTLKYMHGLAVTLARLKIYNEAEELFQEVLELRKEVLGAKHPDTLISMRAVAVALCYQQEYEEGEKLMRHVRELEKQVLGEKHPSTIGNLYTIAAVLALQDKYEEAERLMRQAVDLSKEVQGEKHPDTIRYAGGLVRVLQKAEIARGPSISASSKDDHASTSSPSTETHPASHQKEYKKHTFPRFWKRRSS